jgi:isoleucyl-tRNA synthetase
MEFHFPEQEKKILARWRRHSIFEKSVTQRAGARDFVFYEGPPTANARPGIHHVLSRVYKDIICRYKTMRGYRVERKAGWDTHGLPVELEIEKKLGFKTKKEIERYGIAKFNQQCKKSVWAYKKDWERLTERIGFWLDMANPYITYDTNYIETLWWIVKEIWRKNLLYQDYKVVPYCPRCGTSLSSHEVALGYKTVKEPAIYIKFQMVNHLFQRSAEPPLQNAKFYLLAWTTTPWTLPGNVAVAVHPDLTYVAARKGDEVFIVAKNRLSVLGDGYEVLREYQGKDLRDIKYQPLFEASEAREKAYYILSGNFVSATEGTGLVHIAPAFGEEDMEVVKRKNSELRASNLPEIPILVPVDDSGCFKPEIPQWSGMFVKDADRFIIENLRQRGLLFKEEMYEHEYPFCWRCSSPLLYYAKEAWFIKTTEVKDKLIENNKKINWIPSHIKNGRFGEWLNEVKDWAFSRERYWGTPLPIWQCEKCRQKELIGSIDDFVAKKSLRNRYFLVRHGHSLRQVKNVAMCWPEKMPFPLTKRGQKEASLLARKLKEYTIDFIFASDLLRTKQTANIIAKETGAKVLFDKRLREYNVGSFNGKDPRKAWEYLQQKGDIVYTKLPKGESIADLARRMYTFLQALDKKYSNKNIVIVSHELPLTLLEGVLQGFPLKKILEYRSSNRINRLGTGEYKEIDFRSLPLNRKMELDLHRPYVDEVVFPCNRCGNEMRRTPEVIDVWFDSGAMPFAQSHWPFHQTHQQKSKIKNHQYKPPVLFPADYISEAVDQTRGWFYTLLAVSTLLGFGPPYKNVISLGHVLDEKGEKMSKSKGNVVNPWQIIEQYGVDAVRWYFFTASHPGDSKFFSEKDLQISLQKFLLPLWNSYLFWELYARKAKNLKPPIQYPKSHHVLDRWILSRLESLIESVTARLDGYDVMGSAREIEEFVLDDFSQWYIRRSRRRLQKQTTKKEFEEAALTFAYVLFTLAKLCAPFVPFLSEELYLRLGGQKQSVHLEDWPQAKKQHRDLSLEDQMRDVRKIVAFGLAERAKAGIKVRQPLALFEVDHQKGKMNDQLVELIKDELNVKEVIFGKRRVLHTTLTDELRKEGHIREILRHIQDLRKEAGLKPHQFITLFYDASNGMLDLLKEYQTTILSETRATSMVQKRLQNMKEVIVDGKPILLGLKKK